MPRPERWTDAERQALSEHYHAVSNRDLTRLLSTRTEKAIERQALRLNVKKCHERLREMGRENIAPRWAKRPPVQ